MERAELAHIARHDVTPKEGEELFDRPRMIVPSKKVEGRFEAYRTTVSRRYLVVIFARLKPNTIRTITAYSMNSLTRKKYAPKLRAEEVQKRVRRSRVVRKPRRPAND